MRTRDLKPGFAWTAVFVLAGALAAGGAAAQQPRQPRPRAGETIVIHGQVPTPQVVTVRPRAVPDYSRQVLGPALFDQVRAGAMMGGYQLVERRQVTGQVLVDTAGAAALAADSMAMAAQQRELARTQARLDSLRRAPASPAAPGRAALSPADSAARAAEIQAIMKELEVRRARLDSLAAAVRSMGVPDTTRDSTRVPRDSTRKPTRPR